MEHTTRLFETNMLADLGENPFVSRVKMVDLANLSWVHPGYRLEHADIMYQGLYASCLCMAQILFHLLSMISSYAQDKNSRIFLFFMYSVSARPLLCEVLLCAICVLNLT